MSQNPLTITITPGSIITAILLILGVITLFALQNLVLIVLTAIVISSSIEPGIIWFMHYRVPRVLAVLFLYILVIGTFLGGLYFFIPPVLDEASLIMERFPPNIEAFGVPALTTTTSLFTSSTGYNVGTIVGGSLGSTFETIREIQKAFTDSSEGLFRTVSTVFGGVFSFGLIIVLSFYFAVQETGIDDFLRIVTPVKHQAYMLDLWRRSHMKIGLWMQGQILLSVLIGVLVYLGLSILGIRYALLLAIVAAIFELIPVFGSIMAAMPGVAIAFIDGGTTLALLVIGLYLIINQFQSNLIYPLVVKKIVGVPPLLVILALIAGAQLAGFLGIIIAVPLAAAIQEFVSDIQRRKHRELERMASPT